MTRLVAVADATASARLLREYAPRIPDLGHVDAYSTHCHSPLSEIVTPRLVHTGGADM
jgi:hypothetical protein